VASSWFFILQLSQRCTVQLTSRAMCLVDWFSSHRHTQLLSLSNISIDVWDRTCDLLRTKVFCQSLECRVYQNKVTTSVFAGNNHLHPARFYSLSILATFGCLLAILFSWSKNFYVIRRMEILRPEKHTEFCLRIEKQS